MKKTFDDIIRKRWDDRHFDVDDSHRQEMIDLLEGKKHRKALPIWWWGAGVLVLATIGYLWMGPSGDSLKDAVQISLTQSSGDDVSSKQFPSSNVSATPTSKENSSISKPSEETISAKNESEIKANTRIPPSSGSSSENQHKISLPEPASPSSSGTTINKDDQINKDFTTNVFGPEYIDDADVHHKTNLSADAVTVIHQEKQQEEKKDIVVTHQGIELLNSTGSADQTKSHEVIADASTQIRSQAQVTRIDALPAENLQYTRHQTMPFIKPGKKKFHPIYSFAEAGIGMVLASQPDYDAGLKFNAGAGLGYMLKPRLHLLWSAGYLLQDGGFDFERTSTVNQAGFGVRSQFNSLTPDRLHFVYSRVGLQYRSKKHVFHGVLGLQYLYGAQGHISVHTTEEVPQSDESTSRYSWLKTDGIRKWQWNAGISYGYRITPRLQASIGAQYYFTSLEEHNPQLQSDGYYWNGTTAKVQPFITFNYLLYDLF